MTKSFFSIFRRGSKTYFYSSIFFPPALRQRVFTLYGFVRTADDFVDAVPQQAENFHAFRRACEEAMKGAPAGDMIIDSFTDLSRELSFDPRWTDAFLDAMEADLTKSTYNNLAETESYMYGSAEVIGLYMARIMDLPVESYTSARHLGKAMQYINFIRDIAEDLELGRTYLPLHGSGLASLEEDAAKANRDAFEAFIRTEIARYLTWQAEAEKGFSFIPPRYLIPIKTASDMYRWTARRIHKNPMIVYQKKMKPSIPRILTTILANTISIWMGHFFRRKML